MAVFECWFLGQSGLLTLGLVMIPVCIAVGWLFSYFMWEAVKDDAARISEELGEHNPLETK